MTEHYIGVENAIERILAVAEECGTDTIHIDRIIVELENIPSSPAICIHPRWIPVTERLPELSGEYLVYCGEYDGICVLYYEILKTKGKWRSKWKEVTHWMPLPDSPKEGVKNEL